MTSAVVQGFLIQLSTRRGWPEPDMVDGHAVWFHGYLAHPDRLRAALGLDGRAPPSRIVANAWARWGCACADRLTGEYAVVVMTGSEAAMWSDRMGLRPLYLATGHDGATASGDVTVSTDLGLLARETGAWRDVDEQYIADMLGAALHLGSRTPYRRIHRLAMGEHATWRHGRLTLSGGWQPATAPIAGSIAEHEALLRSAVDDAVAGSLPDPETGPVVVELSGGLDTSTVLAAALPRAPVHAVSFVHPGAPGSDESEWIRTALDSTPAPWHPIDASEHGIFRAGPEFGTFLPAPSRHILNWASTAAEDDVVGRLGGSVVLTGEGGDAVFLAGLYPWYLADLLRSGRWLALRREVRRWAADSEGNRPAGFWLRRAAVDGLRRWRSHRTLTLQPRSATASAAPWLSRTYIGDQKLDARPETTTPLRAGSVHAQAVLENIVRCAEFARTRRLLPSGTVEPRHPLLAPGLVDLALATPWQVGADPRIDRAVQRYAFGGMVSDRVLRRRSKTIADEAVLRGYAGNPRWRETLGDDPLIAARGYVDAAGWRVALDSIGRAGSVTQLYAAIQVEVWLRHLRHAGPPALLR